MNFTKRPLGHRLSGKMTAVSSSAIACLLLVPLAHAQFSDRLDLSHPKTAKTEAAPEGPMIFIPDNAFGIMPSLKKRSALASARQTQKPAAVLHATPAPQGSILMNQHGFSPGSAKLAVLMRESETPAPFTVENSRGETVLSGQSVNFGLNAASGHNVHHIDLSALRAQGESYRVSAGGVESHPFDIKSGLYRSLAKDSLAYFYQSRAAIPIESAYVDAVLPALSRPAGHLSEVASCFAGTDLRGTVWPGCSIEQDVSGGWYDAGDYGKYTVNTGVSIFAMLNFYEMQKLGTFRCAEDFQDGAQPLPEAGDGINDLLNEAKYAIQWMLKMQIDSSDPVAVSIGTQGPTGPLTLSSIDADGMAFHKVHGARWPDLPLAAHADTQTRYLYPPSTAATLGLAAIGAQCARLFNQIDPAFAQTCLSASRKAFTAAQNRPDVYSYDNFDGGGPYSDNHHADEFTWAATELWLTTGEPQYEAVLDQFLGESFNVDGNSDFSWGYTEFAALLSLSASARTKRPAEQHPREAQALRDIGILARNYAAQSAGQGMAIPYSNLNYYWGSNSTLLNRAIIMGVQADLTGDPEQRAQMKTGVTHVLDYLLGRNPLSQSYITGYGEQAMSRPHHRFWANSSDPSFPAPPRGVVSGGPNNTAMIDPIAQTLQGSCTGQTCWDDHIDAYSLNEVTVNWNAPLVWVSGWMNAQDNHCREAPRTLSEIADSL